MSGIGLSRNSRQFGEGSVKHLLVEFAILELAGEIIRIGLHVGVAVARQVEQDRAGCALLLALERFIDGGAYRVIGFRRGHDAFAAGKHKTLDRVGVNVAAHVLVVAVRDGAVRGKILADAGKSLRTVESVN
jgi:hypothetical protein